MRTYVGISRVMYHDSHDGITLWSSLCGRVLNGEHEKMRENEIYSTFVHRDKSELARRNGVEFRKCDLSKRVPSDDVWRAYRDQMLKEQDDWLDKTHLPIREPPDKVVQYLGQSSFGVQIGAQFDTQRSERERRYQRRRNMRGNLLPNWRKAVSEVSYRGPLMLCVDDGRDAAAWSPDFGIVCIESPVLQRGCEILEKGQWFYANMR
ncbi:unnamed protein product [Heligmosomoides polygyrus]|uniref:NADAR domain-containing protein n=1 Tax=Heligmosomoides polygyrus TaxID=6339 RepID=A0A183GF76_HELPZ|nr:unnamed protein product [Heligmosomoides polygyrus]